MTNGMTWITRGVLGILAVSAIGCGQGFKSGSSSSGSSVGAKSVDVSDQLAAADKAAKDAQVAMAEAQDAIAQITDSNGNVNVSLFTKTSGAEVQTSGLLAPLIAKIKPLFTTVISKVVAVKSKFDSARLALADALGKLNANDPAQASLIATINAQMAVIDKAELAFTDTVHKLAGKLDLAIVGLDKIVSGVTSFIPGFGWLADMALDMLVMGDVKDLILDFKAQLLAI